MRREALSGLLLILILGLLTSTFDVGIVRAGGIIHIRVDGSIDPPTAPILTFDNVTYIFTDNIYDEIAVERSYITIDGDGYALEGSGFFNLTNVSNVTIKRTNIKGYLGVSLTNSSHNTISGNNITENKWGDGVRLHSSSDNTVSENNITKRYYGIHLSCSANNNIFDNYIAVNKASSIELHSSSNGNSIFENNVMTNNHSGIHLWSSSSNCIYRNNITENQESGIQLFHSPSNIVWGNNITENHADGIHLWNSSDNIISHNNIVDNTIQVYTYDSVNVWDDVYPSGGNYWSDYTGVDLYGGTYQNETGSDGIGDTPYLINANNQDTYPLMQSVSVSDAAPKPLIIDPSSEEAEAPYHGETIVVYGATVNIRAVEVLYADDIEFATFLYSIDGENWFFIGKDFESAKEQEGRVDIYGIPFSSFDMWTVDWDTSGLTEGLYYIRVLMMDENLQFGEDQIQVYFELVPPIPLIYTPVWGDEVKETIEIKAKTDATDVDHVVWEYLNISDKKTFEDKVPKVGDYGVACVWNAKAALLKYWANFTDKNGKKPFRDLTLDDKGNEMTASELIRRLYLEYILAMLRGWLPGIRRIGEGLTLYEENVMLAIWLKKKNLDKEFEMKYGPDYPTLPFRYFKLQLELAPFLVIVEKVVGYDKAGKPIVESHEMVATSVENKPLPKETFPPDMEMPKGAKSYYKVDFMDSYKEQGGSTKGKCYRVTAMSDNGFVWMDWNENTHKDKDDGWFNVTFKKQLLPKSKALMKDLGICSTAGNWTVAGIDYDGSDGWNLTLDTTKVQDGYCLIRATMVDSAENNCIDVVEIFVHNHLAPRGPGDVNGDGIVNIFDVVEACVSYGSIEGDPNWNPSADQAPPLGIIDIFDVVTIAYNYGKEYP